MSVHVCCFLILTVILQMTRTGPNDAYFRITTKRTNDKVEVQIDKNLAVLSIRSPQGIGQAKIERSASRWPQKVTLQMHLKGLESFKIRNGKVKLEVAVSSHGIPPQVSQWQNEKSDSLLDRENPYWIDLRILGKDGKSRQTIPTDDGYFELRLPAELFKENPDSIEVSWIDFYR